MKCVVVGTWSFSMNGVKSASDYIKLNMDKDNLLTDFTLDAVEKGINVLEGDASYGKYFVGRGGVRNREGYLELDAAIMNGKTLQFGAVTALQGIEHPISVARKVLECSPHNMLTGNGAQKFAVNHGFVPDKELLEKEADSPELTGLDTVGVICLTQSNIAVGVSTSGMGGKESGRVGDSALPGSGLYADMEGGAACCSGDGDEIMKHCPAFRVVHYMKQGETPQQACSKVTNEICQRSEKKFELVIIAVDMKGNIGTGSTISMWKDPKTKEVVSGFPYVVWEEGMLAPERREHKLCEKS